MNLKKEDSEEEFVFEFYDDDFTESLESEVSKEKEKYKKVNFEEDLNDEQLEIINNIKG